MRNTPLLKFTLLLSAMLTMMAGAVMAPSLPQINEVFKDVEHAALLTRQVITLPALLIALLSPLYGQLIDKHGRKKWLLMALVLYAISGTSGFYLNNIYLILIGRALLGVSVAGIMTICTTLVGDYFKGPERGSFLGLQSAFISLGGVFFITLAGLFADIHWQLPFLIYLFSVPVLIMASLFLYEPDIKNSKKIDLTENSNNKSYNKGLIAIIYITIFLAVVFFYMIPVQLPFMLKKIDGVTNSMIGYAISVQTLFAAIFSINYQRFKKNFSFPIMYLFAFIFMAVGYYFISRSSSYNHYLYSLAFSGMGLGFLMPTGSLWVMEIAPTAMRGRLVSGVSTSMFLGMFFSPILVQPIIINTNLGYSKAFLTASIILTLMAIFYFLYRKKLMKE